MVIWVTNPSVKLAGAWGEHTTNQGGGTTSAATPGLDAGTGIPPQPLFDGGKIASLVVDADGDGFISPGDTIEYDIRINNVSHVPVPDIVVKDNLPADTTYVPGSTQYRVSSGGGVYGSFIAIADAAGPSLPLAGTGFTISTLPVGEQAQVVFRVVIDSYAESDTGRHENRQHRLPLCRGHHVAHPRRNPAIRPHRRPRLDRHQRQRHPGRGEPGLSGVTVNVRRATDNTVAGTTTTNASGLWSVSGLAPGDYYVEFVPPSGYSFTQPDQGGNDATDSDANTTTGRTATTTLTSGETDNTWDAGLYQPGSISGQVRNDQNADGNLAAPDPVIAGVTIQLYTDPNGDGDPADGALVTTTTTNGSGNYTFSNVAPGTYVVIETNLAGYVSSGDKTAPNDDRIPVTLPSGGSSTGNDFLDYQTATLGDRVWTDTNGNGIQDAGEPGLAGVTVNVRRATDNTVAGATTTNASGLWSVSGLAPGDYYVEFVPPSGYSFTQPDQGGNDATDSDANTTTGHTATTTLTSGETDNTWDAGLYQPATLGDRVWTDTNGNGIQDAGEPGLSGVTVNVRRATDNTVAGATTTNASGLWSVSDLAPGDYYVEFMPPNGYSFTQPDQGGNDTLDSDSDVTTGQTAPITLGTGETNDTLDAGLVEPESDFGDLPDTTLGMGVVDYQTLLANNGPRHTMTPDLYLGACVDSDGNGQPGSLAKDDNDNAGTVTYGTCTAVGDEDGVARDMSDKWIPGATVTVERHGHGGRRAVRGVGLLDRLGR